VFGYIGETELGDFEGEKLLFDERDVPVHRF